jgi:CheY-like chemotaxis protein
MSWQANDKLRPGSQLRFDIKRPAMSLNDSVNHGESKTADIPVIVVSADAMAGQAERLLAAGAERYITKPLDVPKLLEAIRETLARSGSPV